MKQIRLRIEVTADDGATTEHAQANLREILETVGTRHVGPESNPDLAGDNPGGRVFWMTADVKRGLDPQPPVVTSTRRKREA